jgi:1-deoxy-D-xylulose 5-phosphate reductoisomerase
MKRIAILGSTGSIGRNAICRRGTSRAPCVTGLAAAATANRSWNSRAPAPARDPMSTEPALHEVKTPQRRDTQPHRDLSPTGRAGMAVAAA